MWHNFIGHFVAGLVGAGVAGLIFWWVGRKSFGWTLMMVLMLALVTSVPQIAFGYFPTLDRGWLHFAVIMGIALVISIPFSILAQRFSRKHDNDA